MNMTNTDICNMALAYIAKTRIISLNDNREEARQCKMFYDHNREQLLRNYNWGFAKKHADLALLNEKIRGWQYAYAYPAECLAVRFIYNEENATIKETDRKEFDICLTKDNTQVICCNIANARLEYTVNAIDPKVFSRDFIEALARMLASNIALALTGNASVAQQQFELYHAALQQARVSNFYERQKDTVWPTAFIEARN